MSAKYEKRNKEIAREYMSGRTCAELSKEYGISRQRVFQITKIYDVYQRKRQSNSSIKLEMRLDELFEYICDYKAEHDGLSPIISDYSEKFTCIGHDMVIKYLHKLEDRGKIIVHGNGNRVEVVGGKWIMGDK